MKKILLVLACAGVYVHISAAPNKKDKNIKKDAPFVLENRKDSVGYAYGALVGASFHEDNVPGYLKEMNLDTWVQAFDKMSGGGEALMTFDDAMAYLVGIEQERYYRDIREREAKAEAEREQQIAEAERFFAENAEKEGVVVMVNGLQYKVVNKSGEVEKPDDNSMVSIKYKYSLADGTVLEEEYDEPDEIYIGNMPKGCRTGLKMMSRGDIYTFYLPYFMRDDKYYGDAKVPEYAPLIFEVELIDFEDYDYDDYYDYYGDEDDEHEHEHEDREALMLLIDEFAD